MDFLFAVIMYVFCMGLGFMIDCDNPMNVVIGVMFLSIARWDYNKEIK